RNVDAGQHDFGIAISDKLFHLFDNQTHGYGAAGTAAIGDDAKSAAMVAAILYLHEGPGASVHALDEMAGSLAHAHNVVDLHLVIERRAKDHGRVTFGLELVVIADNEVDFFHVAEGAGLGLGSAAGNDDTGVRMVPPRLAHGLLGLPDRLLGHRPGTDDERVVETGLPGLFAHHSALIGVEAAPEGPGRDSHQAGSARVQAPLVGSSLPRHSN